MRTTAVSCVATICLLAGTHVAAAGPRATGRAHMDRQVSDAHDAGRAARVIVKYRPGSSGRLGQRLRMRGIRPDRHHRGVGAYSVSLDAGALRQLALDPDVSGLSADTKVVSHGAGTSLWSALTAPVPADVQSLRRTLGLPAIARGGRGVGVAVIDSGIAPMPDVAGQITAFYDFTAGGIPAYPSDAFGHGTHVAGLIAGSGALSLGGYPGIAPEVRLIGLKVLDANGGGYASHVLSAIEFAIDNRAALGIDVINLSLGHPVLEPPADDPLVQAVERAAAAGIVVVASAGNFGRQLGGTTPGYGGIASPGNAPSALTVGALRTRNTADRRDDRIAGYSSRGPTWYDGQVKPDLLAPGHGLIATMSPLSTLSQRFPEQGPVGGYIALSGTSMAAAVTSGVVALMIEANRLEAGAAPLTPNTVKMAMQYTAVAVDRAESAAPIQLEQGTGGLNAAAAITVARAIDPAAAVGGPWLAHGVTPATPIADTLELWAQRVIWGDRMVWGESINRRQPAWTASVTWGDPTKWGSDLALDETSLVVNSLEAWSTRVVWGTGLVGASSDDEHIVWGNSTGDEHIVWGNSTGAVTPNPAPATTTHTRTTSSKGRK